MTRLDVRRRIPGVRGANLMTQAFEAAPAAPDTDPTDRTAPGRPVSEAEFPWPRERWLSVVCLAVLLAVGGAGLFGYRLPGGPFVWMLTGGALAALAVHGWSARGA